MINIFKKKLSIECHVKKNNRINKKITNLVWKKKIIKGLLLEPWLDKMR